jgi:hypothetical protein
MSITMEELDRNIRKHGSAPWRYRAKLVSEKISSGTRMWRPHLLDSFMDRKELAISIGTGVIQDHEVDGRQVLIVGDDSRGNITIDDGKWYPEEWMAEAAAVDLLENRLVQIDDQINRQLSRVWKLYKEAKEAKDVSA